jgi:hypothetical protein
VSNTNTNYDPKKLRPEKKGTVVWPAMFFEPPEKITILPNFGGNWGYIIFRRIVLGSIFFFKTIHRKNNLEPVPAKFWRELGLHYFPADYFGIDFFFPAVIFSVCNLNPPKNIAGQTTVPFFSVVFFPVVSTIIGVCVKIPTPIRT